MATVVKEKISNDTLKGYFGIKTYDQVVAELATSRAQVARGQYKEAGVVLKELRAQYGL